MGRRLRRPSGSVPLVEFRASGRNLTPNTLFFPGLSNAQSSMTLRYKLRTLLILLAILPPLLAVGWWKDSAWKAEWHRRVRMPGYLGMVPDEEIKGVNGVRVISVKPEGPAEKSGLKIDDLITTIDGKAIANVEEMDAELVTAVAGQKMLMGVRRVGKTQILSITLGTRPAPAAVP